MNYPFSKLLSYVHFSRVYQLRSSFLANLTYDIYKNTFTNGILGFIYDIHRLHGGRQHHPFTFLDKQVPLASAARTEIFVFRLCAKRTPQAATAATRPPKTCWFHRDGWHESMVKKRQENGEKYPPNSKTVVINISKLAKRKNISSKILCDGDMLVPRRGWWDVFVGIETQSDWVIFILHHSRFILGSYSETSQTGQIQGVKFPYKTCT